MSDRTPITDALETLGMIHYSNKSKFQWTRETIFFLVPANGGKQ